PQSRAAPRSAAKPAMAVCSERLCYRLLLRGLHREVYDCLNNLFVPLTELRHLVRPENHIAARRVLAIHFEQPHNDVCPLFAAFRAETATNELQDFIAR